MRPPKQATSEYGHAVLNGVIQTIDIHYINYRLLDSLMVECWHRLREVPGSIPSQGPRHTKDVIKMVGVLPLFSTDHSKGKYCLFSRIKIGK